jgi:hypothetical protein
MRDVSVRSVGLWEVGPSLVDAEARPVPLLLFLLCGWGCSVSQIVAWSIWLGILFGGRLGSSVATSVSRMVDSCSALVALHAEHEGVFSTALNHTEWNPRQTTAELWDRQWLLAYEANKKTWLPSIGSRDHVAADQAFNELKMRNVSFYDDQLAPTVGGGKVPVSKSGYPLAW